MSMLTIPLAPPGPRRHALVLMARLRRLFNRCVEAAIAAGDRQNERRLYRSPLDDVLERAARLRARKRPKQP